MRDFKKNIYSTTEDGFIPTVPFSFTTSVKNTTTGQGLVTIEGGYPGEVISLTFSVFSEPATTFISLEFTAPISVPILDSTHLTRNGSMTLDVNGYGQSTYTYNPVNSNDTCRIEITARSSGQTTGIGSVQFA